MSPENLFAQTTREAPPAPMSGTFIAPTMLPVCCVCGLIRDDNSFPPGLDCWLTQRTYREPHGVDPTEIAHTHTYCPECFRKVRDTVQQYFREIGTSPSIDASPSVLSDASHRTADREKELRNETSAPPGKFCLRCGGLLVPSYTANWERDVTGKPMTLWRCVNCGDCVDHDILANRVNGSGSARVRARPPAGPQYIGWLPGAGTGMTR